MRIRTALVATLMLSTLAACGSENPPAAPIAADAKPRFDGVVVAGTPADARAAGFTECTQEGNGYYGFSCIKPNGTILGIRPLRAVLRLEYPSDLAYDAVRDPVATAYSSVQYQFAVPDYDYEKCEYGSPNPFACVADQTQPLPRLVQALEAGGWIGKARRRDGSDYYKPGQTVVVSFNTRQVYQDIDGQRRLVVEAEVRPETPEIVAEAIDLIHKEQQDEADHTRSGQSFIDGMKAD